MMRRSLSWLCQAIVWLVLLAALGVLAVTVLVPRLTGTTPYTVLTGSMAPAHPPGELVVVRPTPVERLRAGDVITYQLVSGEATVVTHRIVEVTSTLSGEWRAYTQGDANPVPDREPVRAVQVRGRVWYAVPYAGHLSAGLTLQQRQRAVTGVAVGLLGYAAIMLGGAVRDRMRRTPECVPAGRHVRTEEMAT